MVIMNGESILLFVIMLLMAVILIVFMYLIGAVSEERCDEVESLVFDLFANLGASGKHIGFLFLYSM